MTNLKAVLRTRLEGAARVAVLGVGSRLRGDDAAGLLAAEELSRLFEPRPGGPQLAVFLGESAPENLTGEIKRFQPTHLIVLDAADFGRPPGHLAIVEPTAVGLNASLSTHSLPVGLLADYLRRFLRCEVVIIGLQPASREFGARVSAAVRKTALQAAALIIEAAEY